MRTFPVPVYYLLDTKLEAMYRSFARRKYGFTPTKSFRQLHRQTCMQRLEMFIGKHITDPQHMVTQTAAWDTHYATSKRNPHIHRMAINMTVQWGGTWGFSGAASRNVVDRIVRRFMAQYPQASLIHIHYYYHPVQQGYLDHARAVDYVEISYMV